MATVVEQAPSLWKNPSFRRLWIARTISSLGSRVTATAIPLVAAITLEATPGQMAALVLAGQLPEILLGLVAGVWVDRARRRPLLIASDLGRAAFLSLIPIAMFVDRLSFALLWFVTFACASLSLMFAIASVAILPSVVRPHHLVEANSKLHLSETIVGLAGPGLAGMLIQTVTAPKAILVDVGSFLASTWSLTRTDMDDEPTRETSAKGAIASFLSEARAGIGELYRTPLLLSLTVTTSIIMIGTTTQTTVSILFLTRELHFSPVLIGAIAMANGAGERSDRSLRLGSPTKWQRDESLR